MNTPKPERQLFRRNLKLSPYFAIIGGLLAIIPGFWTPLYISYLTLAAIVGGISFLIMWLGFRRHKYLGPVPMILTIICLPIGRALLLPYDLPNGISFRCDLQAVGVWTFVLAALHLAFRDKIKRNLGVFASQ